MSLKKKKKKKKKISTLYITGIKNIIETQDRKTYMWIEYLEKIEKKM